MNSKHLAVIVGLTIGFAGAGSTAQAFDGYGWQPFPWFGYGNNGPAAYSLGNIPAPPYFALHPPVYYSHPVPRSYGRSPFASSGEVQEQRAVAVRVIANPHVKPPAVSAPSDKQPANLAATPKRLANPFYQPPGRDTALAGGRE